MKSTLLVPALLLSYSTLALANPTLNPDRRTGKIDASTLRIVGNNLFYEIHIQNMDPTAHIDPFVQDIMQRMISD
jgi:hypothetical protein